jgi:hypothetical protein
MFAQTQQVARASANLYSLVSCARVNEIEPYAYLLQDFLVEDRPISPVEDHLTGVLWRPTRSCAPPRMWRSIASRRTSGAESAHSRGHQIARSACRSSRALYSLLLLR